MATDETFPTFLTVPSGPTSPSRPAEPTEADGSTDVLASIAHDARRYVSLDADTFRRFVTAARHQRRRLTPVS